jgi:hypothetical protein
MKILFKILITLSITLLVSCKRDRDETPNTPKQKVTVKLTNPVVNVYIENSGSMFGYINGDTEFKTDVRELLTLLKYHYSDKNVHLSFINSKIYPINTNDKISFITNLTSSTFKVGDTFSSEMNKVFNQVLNKTDKNTISILVSDCIYSVDGLANSLNVCKTGTKDAFLTKSKGGFNISSAIVKLNSKFNGIYYDMNNGKTNLNNESRPYYMVLIGSDLALNYISSKVDFPKTKMLGYQDKLVLTSNNYSNKSYYTLVKTTSDIGSYRTSQVASTIDSKKGMERIQLSDRAKGNFTFSIAVDLKNIPITSEYATTSGNYKILEGDYKIKDIIEYNSISSKKLNPTSLAMLKNYDKNPTHIITLESRSKSYSNLKIILKNQIPSWVYQTSTDDDTKSKNTLNRTFGFKYLIEGISEANKVINPKSGNFLEMNIVIN